MARITAIDETKPKAKGISKGSKTNNKTTSSPPSALPVIVLGILSFIVGICIHLKAIHMSPDRGMGQMMEMSPDTLRNFLKLPKSWPGTRFFDDYAGGAWHYFLLLLAAFKMICVDETGRGLLLLVSTCIAPFCTFLAIEGLKDGRKAALSIASLVGVTSLGQCICIGSAMPLVMGPMYAYSRWSEVKTPNYVQPLPSPSQFRVSNATLFSMLAIATFFPTIFIPVEDKHWVLSNVAFQFFPLAWVPLLFFPTRKDVVSKPASASAREKPRLAAAQAYQLGSYFFIFIYYISLYYGYTGFRSAWEKRGDWGNDGHHVLFWDGIGCLLFDYIIVQLDSYVDEAKIKNGAPRRTHEKRFLPEDLIMGLPGLLLLGPGWAMCTYFQRRELRAEKTRFGVVSKDE